MLDEERKGGEGEKGIKKRKKKQGKKINKIKVSAFGFSTLRKVSETSGVDLTTK